MNKHNLRSSDLKDLFFINLHQHTKFSYDSIGGPLELIKRAHELGHSGCCASDHGHMGAVLPLYFYCKDEKLMKKMGVNTPFQGIIGIEFYITDDLNGENPTKYHMTALAKNEVGYKNLCYLSSLSTTPQNFNGSHFDRPKVKLSTLLAHKEGIIVTGSCPAGIIPQHIRKNTGEEEKYVEMFLREFGEDFYFEIHLGTLQWEWNRQKLSYEDTKVNDQVRINKRLIELSKKHGIKSYIVQDAHMLHKEEYPAQTIILQSRETNKNGGKGWHFHEVYYLKTVEEMYEDVKTHHDYIDDVDFVEFVQNTKLIAEKTKNMTLAFSPILPKIDHASHPIHTPSVEEKMLALEKSPKMETLHPLLKERKNNPALDTVLKISLTNTKINWEDLRYQNVLKEELEVINNKHINFCDYFLLLEDVVRFVISKGGVISTGRGSGAGVLVAYALDIIEVDPVRYNLLFERFATLEKLLMAPPDLDFDTDMRDEIKKYLRDKYGIENTSLIGTYMTLATKGAVKEVCRILLPKMTADDVNKLTKKMGALKKDPILHKTETDYFYDVLASNKEVDSFFERHPLVKTCVERIIGKPKASGVHAGGIVISDRPIDRIIPLQWNRSEEMWVTQPEMGWVEKAGLIKYDFLGLNTLKDVRKCFELIEKKTGKRLRIRDIPVDDLKVLAEFRKGNTVSVFQFNTELATSFLKRLRSIDSVEDLSLITSLLRPGPLNQKMDKVFADRKNGVAPVEYLHPTLEPILQESYGLIIYQEQILKITQLLGGFSKASSVEILKALGKKIREKVESFKEPFIKGAMEKGLSENTALELWKQMEAFAEYGFNKSHGIAYAILSYVCMWLKTHHPIEWIGAVLSNADKDEFKVFYGHWKNLIQKPHVNLSKADYVYQDDKLIMPIGTINGVGEKAVAEILKYQPYASFADFFEKVEKRVINKKVLMAMIFGGAFDCFITDKDPVRGRIRLVEEFYAEKQKVKSLTKAEREDRDELLKELRSVNRSGLIVKELALLNFSNGNYHELFAEEMKTKAKVVLGQSALTPQKAIYRPHGETLVVGGCVKSMETFPTKNGKPMMRLILAGETGDISVNVWPDTLEKDKVLALMKEYSAVAIKGKINEWNGTKSLVYQEGLILASPSAF